MLNKPGSSGVDALSIRAAAEAAAASCPPMRSQMAAGQSMAPSSSASVSAAAAAGGGGGGGGVELLDTELLKDRNKAFEHFRQACHSSRRPVMTLDVQAQLQEERTD